MIRIYSQQLGVVDSFRKSLLHWNKQRSQDSKDESHSSSSKEIMDLDFIEEITEQIKTRKAEIEELASAAERSCREVCPPALLGLMQILTSR